MQLNFAFDVSMIASILPNKVRRREAEKYANFRVFKSVTQISAYPEANKPPRGTDCTSKPLKLLP